MTDEPPSPTSLGAPEQRTSAPSERRGSQAWRNDGWRLGYRPGLDHLRAVAVILVLLQHGFPLGRVGWAGGVGVTIFFVLSGFLITRLLIEERIVAQSIDLRRFYGRRARRLLPPLVPAIVLALFANHSTGGALLEPVIGSVLYVANYASVGDPAWGAFSHLWSLAVEEHFYLVWPVMVALLPRRVVVAFAASAVVVVGIARFIEGPTSLAYRATHLRLDALLLGALLAIFIVRLQKPSPVLGIVGMVSLAVWVPYELHRDATRWGLVVIAIGACAITLLALEQRKALAPLVWVGRISYGIYLFHLPVFAVLRVHWSLAGWSLFLLGTAMSLTLAEASFRWIETPIRARGRTVGSATFTVR